MILDLYAQINLPEQSSFYAEVFITMRPIFLILIYTLVAGLFAGVASPIIGSSLLLTGLEVLMIVHLAKRHEFKLKLSEIGFAATAIWGVSTILKDFVLEVMVFIPGPGWIARVIVASVFVFFLGILANLHFS